MNSPILAPVIALVLWTFVMWAWMYATRIPAIARSGIVYDPHRPTEEFMNQIPAPVRWKSDNYNHLMEQPTLFYAVALTLALAGQGGGLNADLAWAYMLLRVVHSLIQALINKVEIRFAVFTLGSFALLAMTIRAAFAVF